MVDQGAMKAYSEDLRQKVVEAVERRGTSKSEAARLLGISLSSVKRYTRLASEGEPLAPRKGGGRPPKADALTRKLLEEDIQAPRGGYTRETAATVGERRHFLQTVAGNSLSEPTLRRLLKRMGFSRKKDCGGAGTRRVAKSRFEGDGIRRPRCSLSGFRGRDGHEHLAVSRVWLVQEGREGSLLGAPQSRQEHHAVGHHDRRRDGAIAGRGRRDQRQGLRDVRGAGPCAEPARRSGGDGGDGQPLGPQRRAG